MGKLTFLSSIRESFKVEGKMSYEGSSCAWNLIRLKKEILQDYPQLKDRSRDFSYAMSVHTTYKEIKKVIDRMERECKALPVLLFFCERVGKR